MRFDIAYGRTAPLLTMLGLFKSRAYLDVTDTTIEVRMSWAFKVSIPRADIHNVIKLDKRMMSIGVHGWNGSWLVNGQQNQLVRIAIDPAVKAKVGFFPVNLRQLTVSLEDPDGFAAMMAS